MKSIKRSCRGIVVWKSNSEKIHKSEKYYPGLNSFVNKYVFTKVLFRIQNIRFIIQQNVLKNEK